MIESKTKSKSIFIKNVKCEVCGIIGSLQVLNPNTFNGRIRHFISSKRLDGKMKYEFKYCKVSVEFVKQILADQKVRANADQTNSKPDQSIATHDLNLQDSSPKIKENYRFLSAVDMRSKAFLRFSTELAKDKRR